MQVVMMPPATAARRKVSALLVFALLAAALAVAPQGPAGATSSDAISAGAGAAPAWHTDLLNRVNQVRASHGAPALRLCTNLNNAAQGHSNHMSATGSFSHVGAGGSTVGSRARAAGYQWTAVAENLAVGQTSVAAVVAAWTTSGGHLANMVNPAYRHLGVGRAGNYWAQVFGAGGSCADPAIGNLDAASSPTAGKLSVRGWAVAPNAPSTAISVRITVDGVARATLVANLSRPDVGAAHPWAGARHGFAGTVNAPFGQHQVCAVALNVGGGPATTALGCRSVWIGDPTSPFSDVVRTDDFFSAIVALSSAGIISGFPDGTFRPTRPVTRQATAAFLHRLAGSPPATLTAPFFADVGPGHAFYGPIQWMAQRGISVGSPNPSGGKPLFGPAAQVGRQAMAAFLHRYSGSPAPTLNAPFFVDIGRSHAFYGPIQWMAERGLSTGTPVSGGVAFQPGKVVSRQVMAAFLHRL